MGLDRIYKTETGISKRFENKKTRPHMPDVKTRGDGIYRDVNDLLRPEAIKLYCS
jgi:hypothetical protein